ncbi:MAG: glycosyltransferase [Victivallaceae bacterium]|nr:glycosyltransferase [Victivallaceae bacterium]
MRILHYFLGFDRQGGLNRYAKDLASAQRAAGHDVFALFPDGGILPRKRPEIKKAGCRGGIECFRLTGGAVVPLLEGIRDPDYILLHPRLGIPEMEAFYRATTPDVLHVHSWMGFPDELFDVLKAHGVRIVFTTHDYFGICPKVNLLRGNGMLCDAPGDMACTLCNAAAPSPGYLHLRNWRVLFRLRSLLLPLKKCFFRHRSRPVPATAPPKDFTALRAYYGNLLAQCDKIHFNSDVSALIYRKYFPALAGKVIPITHGGIADRRVFRKTDPRCVALTYLGADAFYKGLPRLVAAFAGIARRNRRLDIWGTDTAKKCDAAPEIYRHGRFSPSELTGILRKSDLVIVPSVWFETFGFVVPEALSHGVPVLASDTVGAKMLLPERMIFHGDAELAEKLDSFLAHPETLDAEKEKICSGAAAFPVLRDHAEAMTRFYVS